MIQGAAAITDAGPRPKNEDSHASWWAGSTFFSAVADGLGGLGGGARASAYAVDFLKSTAVESSVGSRELVRLVQQAHEGLCQLQLEQPEFRTMATTLTVVGVAGDKLSAAHCGDTRLYVARRNGIKRLSEDHSEGERLFKEGVISRRELSQYPRKHILESALGVKGGPTIQGIEFDLLPNDWIILASDGAYGKLASAEIRDMCKSLDTPEELVEALRLLVKQRVPTDNYTMVVARVSADQ